MNRFETRSLIFLCAAVFGIAGCETEDTGVGKVEFIENTQLGPTSERVLKEIKTQKDETPVPSKTGPWPKIVAEQTVHQFGRMALGATDEYTYKITNAGDADLELLAGRPSCNCTEFSVSKQIVKPGESAEVHLHWKAKQASKRYEHHGPLLTNDPENPKVEFWVKGVVDTSFKIMPALQWDIGAVDLHSEGHFTAMVGSAIFKGFTIDELNAESEHLSFETEAMAPSELDEFGLVTGYRIHMTLAKDAPAGLFESKLAMKVSCEEKPSELTISAMKRGPISVLSVSDGGLWIKSSGGIRLGRFQSREGRKVSMLFAVSTEVLQDELKLSDVTTSPAWIKWNLETVPTPSKDVQRYRLFLEIPPGSPRDKRNKDRPAMIEMKTNIPNQPDWKVLLAYTSF